MRTGLLSFNKNVGFYLLLLYILSITGCTTTTPSQYYLLSPIQDPEPASIPHTEKIHIIGVGPIKFPKYLNRSPIVRFSGSNKVLVDDFNRWAESLEQNFSRVLRINLTRLLTSSYAIEYPWKRAMNVRYQIMLEVHQFETDSSGNVNLSAHWAILNLAENKKIEVVRKFNYSQKLDSITYEKIVAGQSRALEKLSQKIAGEISKLVF